MTHMKLPIAQESYRPSPQTLVRAISRTRVILGRAAGEETPLDGATALTQPRRPGVRCANFAADLHVSASADADQILRGVFDHFHDRRTICHALTCSDARWNEAFTPAAVAAGYQPRRKHVFLLDHYRPPKHIHPSLQIIPARSLYPQLGAFYEQMARQDHHADGAAARDLAQAMIDQLDEPRLEVFIGRLDRKPVGCAGVLTLGNIGVISPAYTEPGRRGQGVAGALMAAILEHCARAQFEQVILERSEGCPSIPFYRAMGFEPVSWYVRYALKPDGEAHGTNT